MNANQLDLSKAGKDYGNEYFLNGQPSYLFTTLAQYIPNLAPARAATQDEIVKIVPPNQLGLEELPEAAEELLGLDETSESTIIVDGVAADFATATGVEADMSQTSQEALNIENAEKIDIDLKPEVSNSKLKNIVNDIYKGQSETSPNTIGNGTTMDAVRNEQITGEKTFGKFHTTKLTDICNRLERRLRAGDLDNHDRSVVYALVKDIKNVLGD